MNAEERRHGLAELIAEIDAEADDFDRDHYYKALRILTSPWFEAVRSEIEHQHEQVVARDFTSLRYQVSKLAEFSGMFGPTYPPNESQVCPEHPCPYHPDGGNHPDAAGA